jgi:hypothetical protein
MSNYEKNGWDFTASDQYLDWFYRSGAVETAIYPHDVAFLFATGGAAKSVMEGALASRGEGALASRGGQEILDEVSAKLAANPGLAKKVLSEAEYAAGQNSVGVARMQYGNAIERLFWEHIENSGQSRFFQRLGGASKADGIVNGQLFDITTTNPITVQRHFARPYGEGLQLFKYERPSTFTLFP